MKTGIVIVAHGSPQQTANQELLQMAGFLRESGEYAVVQPAFLEQAEPDVPAGIDRCIAQGAERVVVVPYFLVEGSHVRQDLPELVQAAARKYPGVPVRVAEPLGYHPVLLRIVLERVDELLASTGQKEPE